MKSEKEYKELENTVFLTRDVARITGLKEKAVVNLAARKIVQPDHSLASGAGSRRLYSWRNCVQIGIVRVLMGLGMPAFIAEDILRAVDTMALWKSSHKKRRMIIVGIDPLTTDLDKKKSMKIYQDENPSIAGSWDIFIFDYENRSDLYQQLPYIRKNKISKKEKEIPLSGEFIMPGIVLIDINTIIGKLVYRFSRLKK